VRRGVKDPVGHPIDNPLARQWWVPTKDERVAACGPAPSISPSGNSAGFAASAKCETSPTAFQGWHEG